MGMAQNGGVRDEPPGNGGISNASETQLRAMRDWYERVVHWGGVVVVAGVLLEIPLIWWPLACEWLNKFAQSLCTLAIGLGVAAEVYGVHKSGLAQAELLRLSEKRLEHAQGLSIIANDMANVASVDAANAMQQLADAKRSLGEAIERASKAELEAAKINAQMAPRSLAGHQDAIAEKIRPWAGTRAQWGANPDLPESQILCRAIAATLSQAGWAQSPGTPTHQPMYPGGIVVASTDDEGAQAAARALSHALREAGIFAVSAPMLEGPSSRVFITVGVKPSAADEEQARKAIENIPITQRP